MRPSPFGPPGSARIPALWSQPALPPTRSPRSGYGTTRGLAPDRVQHGSFSSLPARQQLFHPAVRKDYSQPVLVEKVFAAPLVDHEGVELAWLMELTLAACVMLLPWVLFVVVFALVSFDFRYQHTTLCFFVLAVACALVVASGVFAFLRFRTDPEQPLRYQVHLSFWAGCALLTLLVVFLAAIIFCCSNYRQPYLALLFVAIAGLLIVGIGLVAFLGTYHRAVVNGRRDRLRFWPTFMFLMLLLALVCGLAAGCSNYHSKMLPAYNWSDLNRYTDVDPAQMAGKALIDGGRIHFKETAHLDLTKAFAFHASDVFCVVPIVSGSLPTPQANEPPPVYDYWAAGTNCCTGDRHDFRCGDAVYATGGGGLRIIGQQEHNFRFAVEEAGAHFGLRTTNTPIILQWVQDPEATLEAYRAAGFHTFLMMAFAFFLAIVALTFLAAFLHNFCSHRQSHHPYYDASYYPVKL